MKAILRTHARTERRNFVASLSTADRVALERQLAANVAPLLIGGKTAAAYAATGDEISPGYIPHTLFPRVIGKTLGFHRCPRTLLIPGILKIPEPPAHTPQAIPDILLVPLLAVTVAGVRLGQGGGYYDRSLENLRRNGHIVAIGLAWDIQITESLPVEAWDQPLDYIATPIHLVDCARHR